MRVTLPRRLRRKVERNAEGIYWADGERLDYADRRRVSIRVVAPEAQDVSLIAYADKMRRAMDCDVAVVFAYYDDQQILEGLPYTVACAQVSGDDHGWSGDGAWLGGVPMDGQRSILARR